MSMDLYFYAGACSLVPHIVARELNLDVNVHAAPRPVWGVVLRGLCR